jgi:hypothetical protein
VGPSAHDAARRGSVEEGLRTAWCAHALHRWTRRRGVPGLLMPEEGMASQQHLPPVRTVLARVFLADGCVHAMHTG